MFNDRLSAISSFGNLRGRQVDQLHVAHVLGGCCIACRWSPQILDRTGLLRQLLQVKCCCGGFAVVSDSFRNSRMICRRCCCGHSALPSVLCWFIDAFIFFVAHYSVSRLLRHGC